jgi:signal peptidase I
VRFTVSSGSMRPWLDAGTPTRVRAVEPLRVGDVVVVRMADGTWRTHRLVGRMWWQGVHCWVTMGDNNPRIDAPVPPERIAGVIIAAQVGTG